MERIFAKYRKNRASGFLTRAPADRNDAHVPSDEPTYQAVSVVRTRSTSSLSVLLFLRFVVVAMRAVRRNGYANVLTRALASKNACRGADELLSSPVTRSRVQSPPLCRSGSVTPPSRVANNGLQVPECIAYENDRKRSPPRACPAASGARTSAIASKPSTDGEPASCLPP
jgi:hypothetical protein